MPTFNEEAYNLYQDNADLMKAVDKFSKENYKHGADTEHNKIFKMCKYAVFNEQLTIAQLGWAKAYARRNNLDISSTQSADSSISSAIKL